MSNNEKGLNNKGKILIIEDETITATYIKQILEEHNYSVIDILSSGEGILKEISKNKPDLILMDIILKGDIDGISLTAMIKQKFDTPVVYLTAHTDDFTLDRAKITYPDGYLVKPFNERELFATIEMVIHKYKSNKNNISVKSVSRKPSEKRRQEIVYASLNILIKEGSQKFTIRNIASKMEITEGAIYKHFESKEEITSAIVKEIDILSENFFKNIIDIDIKGWEKLKILCSFWCKEFVNNNLIINLLFLLNVPINEENVSYKIDKIKQKQNLIIKEIIEEIKSNNQTNSKLDTDHLVSLVSATVSRTISQFEQTKKDIDLYGIIDDLQQTMINLLS